MNEEIEIMEVKSLRQGIKIRKLIQFSINKYPNISLDECLTQIKSKNYHYRDCFLNLLFRHKYKKDYVIYQNSLVVHVNDYSGRFFKKKPSVFQSQYNEFDFFLYLGTTKSESYTYDVMLDFITLSTSVDFIEFEQYIEIFVPEKIIDDRHQDSDMIDKKCIYDGVISGKLSDFNLQCKDGEIPVSKVILSLHSPYFQTFFQGYFHERMSEPLEVTISDMKKYIYYCFFDELNMDDIEVDLIIIGKYFLDDSFVKYVYSEMIVKIDEDENLSSKEKLELYNNLMSYVV